MRRGKHPSIITNEKLMKDWPKNVDGSYSISPHDPSKISLGSAKKVKWICATCSHEWVVKVANRFISGSGCGFCANLRCHSDGRNSVATLYPELLKEWVYAKNPDPLTVAAKSCKPVSWKCSICLHEWLTPPQQRCGNGNGCNKCAVRNLRGKPKNKREPLTDHKDLLKEWDYSKNTLDPVKLTAGSQRYAYWKCSTCDNQWIGTIHNRTKGGGCPYCGGGVNSLHSDGRNSLATKRPDVAAEWDYSKNGDLTPETITVQSFKDIWFICKTCSHEWETKPCVRTSPTHQQGCGYCGGSALHTDGRNSVFNNPKMIKTWDWNKNDTDPNTITYRSNKKYWWICRCGESLEATPNKQSVTDGCSKCVESGISLDKPGFVYLMKYSGGKNGDFFKIGISHKPKKRMAYLRKDFVYKYGKQAKIELIDTISLNTMREAYKLEKAYHGLTKHRFTSEHQIDGYTEFFKESIIDEWGCV
tara:strand:- start:500 stop:1918 length:1419 start_codon:yes stop_codon:yes gene_type:complete